MQLSACYIVRNEAANLARSLESIAGEVDEIIVVDTGSLDDSIKIAESYGAKVFSVPWPDDFSKARNISLAKASGEWILVVDADEYFPDGMSRNLRRILSRVDKDTDLLLLTRRELDEGTGKIIMDSCVPRLLRRVDGLAYEGAIHEEPRHNGRPIEHIGTVPAEELLMMHTGYSTNLTQAKGERNLSFLKKELESGCPRDSIYMYLAETYDGLGNCREAEKYAWLDVRTGRKPFAFASRSYRILLRLLAKRPEAYRKRKEAAFMAVRDFPELPEFHAEYAECLGLGLDYQGAIRENKKALALYADRGTGTGLEPSTFDSTTANLIEARLKMWIQLARDEKEERLMREAAEADNWQSLLSESKNNIWAYGVRIFSLLLLSENESFAAGEAEKLLPPDMAALWRVFLENQPIDDKLENTYCCLLKDILRFTGGQHIAHFIAMASRFSIVKRIEVARILAESEAWAEALSLIPDHSKTADEETALLKGICQYHLGDYEGARVSLSQVRSHCFSSEADSYLLWLEEAAND